MSTVTVTETLMSDTQAGSRNTTLPCVVVPAAADRLTAVCSIMVAETVLIPLLRVMLRMLLPFVRSPVRVTSAPPDARKYVGEMSAM